MPPARTLRSSSSAGSRSSSPAAPSPTASTSAPASPKKLPRLPSDIRDFVLNYPSQSARSTSRMGNLLFYTDKGPGRPSRKSVTGLQDELRGNYRELESSHSFIQWLFPIREMGMNWESQPLEVAEIEAIKADSAAMARRMESYKIMLDFYGMRLVDEETGELGRSETVDPASGRWDVRYANLRNTHNFLRITRILKSNSEFGCEYLNAPFLLFVLVEQSRPESPQLDSASLVRSMDNYWRWCIRDDEEREFVGETIAAVRSAERKWSEEDYRAALERRKVHGSLRETQGQTGQIEAAEKGSGEGGQVKEADAPPLEKGESA